MLDLLVMTGRIASDFKVTRVNDVTKVRFRLCNDAFVNGQKKPQFFWLEAWEKGADLIIKNFRKGDPITVEGELRQEEWEKDGARRESIYVRVRKHHPHPYARRPEDGVDDGAGRAPDEVAAHRSDRDDQIPF